MHRTDKDTWPIKLEIGSSRTKSLEKNIRSNKKFREQSEFNRFTEGFDTWIYDILYMCIYMIYDIYIYDIWYIYIYIYVPTNIPFSTGGNLQAPADFSRMSDLELEMLISKALSFTVRGTQNGEKTGHLGRSEVSFRSKRHVWIFWGARCVFFSQHSKSQEEQKIVFVWMFEVYTIFSAFDAAVESFTFWRHFLIEGKDLWKTVMSFPFFWRGESSRLSDGWFWQLRSLVVHVSASCHRWDDWFFPPRWMAGGWLMSLKTLWLPWFFKNLFVCFFF